MQFNRHTHAEVGDTEHYVHSAAAAGDPVVRHIHCYSQHDEENVLANSSQCQFLLRALYGRKNRLDDCKSNAATLASSVSSERRSSMSLTAAATVCNLRRHLGASTCRRYLARYPTSGMRFITPPVIAQVSAAAADVREPSRSVPRGRKLSSGRRAAPLLLTSASPRAGNFTKLLLGEPAAKSAGLAQSIGGDAIEEEATTTTTRAVSEARDTEMFIPRRHAATMYICDRLVLAVVHRQAYTGGRTRRQADKRTTFLNKFGRWCVRALWRNSLVIVHGVVVNVLSSHARSDRVPPTTLATCLAHRCNGGFTFACLLLIYSFQFRSALQPRSAVSAVTELLFSSGDLHFDL